MVLLSIEPLKAFGAGGLTPGDRISAWDAAATDSVYPALAVNIKNFLSQLHIYSISSLTLG